MSAAANLPWEIKKVIFNYTTITHFWLFVLFRNKTNCHTVTVQLNCLLTAVSRFPDRWGFQSRPSFASPAVT